MLAKGVRVLFQGLYYVVDMLSAAACIAWYMVKSALNQRFGCHDILK